MQVVGSPGVYAAGDVARFPSPQTGDPIRVEHWRVAEQLGRVAAFNMAGVPRVYDDVPYFWTFQYDVGLDYVGHAERWDSIHVDGDIGRREFLAYYIRGEKILAVSGCNRSDQVLGIAELMRAGRMPGAEVLRGGAVDWKALLRR
jgi:NADPH-dependent 2,4-dienoyl-CoA reductase/sulfur reductase-like enzyme